jgi:hypothetical protein
MAEQRRRETESEAYDLLIFRMAVSWVVAPCSLVEVYHRFRGTCCLHHQGDDDVPLKRW